MFEGFEAKMSNNVNSKRFAPVFSNSGLLRQDHWRQKKHKMHQVLNSPDLKFIGFFEGKPLMDVSTLLCVKYFSKAEMPQNMFSAAGVWLNNWVFLGTDTDDKNPIVAVEMSDLPPEQIEVWRHDQIKSVDLRSCAMQFSVEARLEEQVAILGAGKSLLDWHRRHGFCAECGEKTKLSRAGYQRVCMNNSCGAEHFPRTDPVVIMLVLFDDQCLLGRSPHFSEGSFSAIAGFMEQGENIEEAVAREVMEEVGLEIKNVKYVYSQPWPFPSSLMIGCIAEAKDKNFKIDGNELESARWFSKAEIKSGLSGTAGLGFSLPPKLAIAHDLLQNWLQSGEN